MCVCVRRRGARTAITRVGFVCLSVCLSVAVLGAFRSTSGTTSLCIGKGCRRDVCACAPAAVVFEGTHLLAWLCGWATFPPLTHFHLTTPCVRIGDLGASINERSRTAHD